RFQPEGHRAQGERGRDGALADAAFARDEDEWPRRQQPIDVRDRRAIRRTHGGRLEAISPRSVGDRTVSAHGGGLCHLATYLATLESRRRARSNGSAGRAPEPERQCTVTSEMQDRFARPCFLKRSMV